MQRWRLRFNLQEIDLREGSVILGRGSECPITLEDPLVSRRHAEIQVAEAGCVLVDLGSRNGVRLNGVRITAPSALRANDRIRIGRDELVLLSASDEAVDPKSERTTGNEERCERCGEQFPGGGVNCPRCGGTFPGVPLVRAASVG